MPATILNSLIAQFAAHYQVYGTPSIWRDLETLKSLRDGNQKRKEPK